LHLSEVLAVSMNQFNLQQLHKEAKLRYLDGEFLNKKRRSDSGYLLMLLGFELQLKAALYIDKGKNNTTHKYYSIYCTLSKNLKNDIIGNAQIHSQAFDIKNRIKIILESYSYNFVRLRYPYQSYENFTEEEYREYSELYSELGGPDGEAEFEYYPRELYGLYKALEEFVAKNC
jgi:hypothetical protein